MGRRQVLRADLAPGAWRGSEDGALPGCHGDGPMVGGICQFLDEGRTRPSSACTWWDFSPPGTAMREACCVRHSRGGQREGFTGAGQTVWLWESRPAVGSLPSALPCPAAQSSALASETGEDTCPDELGPGGCRVVTHQTRVACHPMFVLLAVRPRVARPRVAQPLSGLLHAGCQVP